MMERQIASLHHFPVHVVAFQAPVVSAPSPQLVLHAAGLTVLQPAGTKVTLDQMQEIQCKSDMRLIR